MEFFAGNGRFTQKLQLNFTPKTLQTFMHSTSSLLASRINSMGDTQSDWHWVPYWANFSSSAIFAASPNSLSPFERKDASCDWADGNIRNRMIFRWTFENSCVTRSLMVHNVQVFQVKFRVPFIRFTQLKQKVWQITEVYNSVNCRRTRICPDWFL